jgi:hypothetical protein
MSEAAGAGGTLTVVCDANVFYSVVMTDLLLSLGVAELFLPRWTNQIHDEWMRNLRSDRPDLDPAKVERRRQLMDGAIDDCLIEGYEHLIPVLNLPDADDRHVLAAAIHGGAQVILTFNQRHFPPQSLSAYGITARHPDDFLTTLVAQSSDVVLDALEEMRARKARPPLTREDLLLKFEKQRLKRFVEALRAAGYGHISG